MRTCDLGLIDFIEAYRLQKDCVRKVGEGGTETVFLCEHPVVVTQGRSTQPGHLLASDAELRKRKIPVITIDRGGDVTLHAPGQLVVYPIIDLRSRGRDLKVYINLLEQTAINFLNDLGIAAQRNPGYTGVWVEDRKIASLGIGVSKWIAYHGIAINININLERFSLIRPCGLDVQMTSVYDRRGPEIGMDEAKSLFLTHLLRIFK